MLEAGNLRYIWSIGLPRAEGLNPVGPDQIIECVEWNSLGFPGCGFRR